MSLEQFKITDGNISEKGVVAAPDKLTGNAQQNKMLFDRLIREAVKGLFNGLIDALSGSGGAAETGVTEIEGLTGDNVQAVLESLKAFTDAGLATREPLSASALLLKSVSFDADTGIFTFTKENGSTITIDTLLEKVVTNWAYDAATQSLVLTMKDGTVQRIPLSDFITETEFLDSDTIDFSVSNHVVTATIKPGSVTDSMLSSALVTMLQGYVSSAAGSASAAASSATAAAASKTAAAASETAAASSESNAASSAAAASASKTAAALSEGAADLFAEDAEAWAVGERDGQEVSSEDETWHNNAKYYAQYAREIVRADMEQSVYDPEGGHRQVAFKNTTVATSEKGAANGVAELDSVGRVPEGQLPPVRKATVTLTANGWSGNAQTVAVTGALATDTVFVSPAPASFSAYGGSGVRCTGQGAGTLTFQCDSVPLVALTVNVAMFGGV